MGKDIFVKDLGFLYERKGHLWVEREWKHFRLRKRLRKALGSRKGTRIIAVDQKVAEELHRYYRVPVERIETKD